jgi:hypothetical protein
MLKIDKDALDSYGSMVFGYLSGIWDVIVSPSDVLDEYRLLSRGNWQLCKRALSLYLMVVIISICLTAWIFQNGYEKLFSWRVLSMLVVIGFISLLIDLFTMIMAFIVSGIELNSKIICLQFVSIAVYQSPMMVFAAIFVLPFMFYSKYIYGNESAGVDLTVNIEVSSSFYIMVLDYMRRVVDLSDSVVLDLFHRLIVVVYFLVAQVRVLSQIIYINDSIDADKNIDRLVKLVGAVAIVNSVMSFLDEADNALMLGVYRYILDSLK